MEQMVNRAQTIIADALIAACAFFLAYLLASGQFLETAGPGLPTLKLIQLVGIYTGLAAIFSTIILKMRLRLEEEARRRKRGNSNSNSNST